MDGYHGNEATPIQRLGLESAVKYYIVKGRDRVGFVVMIMFVCTHYLFQLASCLYKACSSRWFCDSDFQSKY